MKLYTVKQCRNDCMNKNGERKTMVRFCKIFVLVFTIMLVGSHLASAVELQLLVVGHGYVQGEGFACADNCTKTYEKGTVVHLKALPFPDSRFAGWKINGAPHKGVITLEEDTVLSAVFERTEDPMLADGVTVYWYDANGGREYAKINLAQMFITFEDREKWDVSTDEEYHEALQHIAQTFHPQAELIEPTPYDVILKSPEALEKEQWFDRLFAIQELNTVLWTAPVLNMCLEEPCSMTLAWNEMSVYFPQSYTESQIENIEKEYGLQRVEPLTVIPNSFIYQVESPLEAIETANRLYESGLVEHAVPAISETLIPLSELPDDTFFEEQWHLNNTYVHAGEDINVLPAWEKTLGEDIVIAVVDDGVGLKHEDLAPLDDESSHRDFLEGDNDPIDNDNLINLPGVRVDPAKLSPECPSACHGTAVAGVAAAEGFNGKGVSGVAPSAKTIGYRIGLTPYRVTRPRLYNDLFIGGKNGEIDIYNSSYGTSRILSKGYKDRHLEIEDGSKNGIIYVWGAGNDPEDDTNHYGFTSSRYTITVGGSRSDGMAAHFSTPGATVLINAPAREIITTDRIGDKGYNYLEGFIVSDNYWRILLGRPLDEAVPWEIREKLQPLTGLIFKNENELLEAIEHYIGFEDTQKYKEKFLKETDFRYSKTPNSADYTSFTGTSAAAPVVSGVVALMLDARRQKQPDKPFSWRDVQHILIETAHKNQGGVGELLEQEWQTNTNSAGYSHLHTYGFGRVDAGAAVETAISWTPVEPEKASEKYVYAEFGIGDPGSFDTPKPLSRTITIRENLRVEFVEVTFSSDYPQWGDLEITLLSPSKFPSLLATTIDSEKRPYDKWTFGDRRHFGEASQGEWTLLIQDKKQRGNTAKWFTWELQIYGTKLPPPAPSYVKNVQVTSGGKPIYHTGWEPLEEPDQLGFLYYSDPIDPTPGAEAQVVIHTSEAMQELSVALPGQAETTLDPCADMQDGTCWQGELPLPELDAYPFIIRGQDLAGNYVLPFADREPKTLSEWAVAGTDIGDTVHRLGSESSFTWQLVTPTASTCRESEGGIRCDFEDGSGSVLLRPTDADQPEQQYLVLDTQDGIDTTHSGRYLSREENGGAYGIEIVPLDWQITDSSTTIGRCDENPSPPDDIAWEISSMVQEQQVTVTLALDDSAVDMTFESPLSSPLLVTPNQASGHIPVEKWELVDVTTTTHESPGQWELLDSGEEAPWAKMVCGSLSSLRFLDEYVTRNCYKDGELVYSFQFQLYEFVSLFDQPDPPLPDPDDPPAHPSEIFPNGEGPSPLTQRWVSDIVRDDPPYTIKKRYKPLSGCPHTWGNGVDFHIKEFSCKQGYTWRTYAWNSDSGSSSCTTAATYQLKTIPEFLAQVNVQ